MSKCVLLHSISRTRNVRPFLKPTDHGSQAPISWNQYHSGNQLFIDFESKRRAKVFQTEQNAFREFILLTLSWAPNIDLTNIIVSSSSVSYFKHCIGIYDIAWCYTKLFHNFIWRTRGAGRAHYTDQTTVGREDKWASIQDKSKIFSFLQTFPACSVAHPASCLIDTGGWLTSPYACMAWCVVKQGHNFTLTLRSNGTKIRSSTTLHLSDEEA